ncbi:TetR/AcrR family transcriptional regulator [Flavobacterium caseinilyticum]|uniref:TetR/AcrR family transcriptional regulator n=1 Tax=Flavobacterium caseinilyticum TaxID=2541732 RepID=A0A4R5B138_9FLAO|nr:TetR/AcrR family transcriptional regulator [Flavobacterium caseinilyticum]TDD77244.1 TetR/AcrR family transcriptional regulator [Flavobacterium caseinilyticum]
MEISAKQLEIIKAAGRILTASGVSGLTIKELAKEMQFSESAIYRHFESKEEIVLALLDFLATNMDERLTASHSINENQKEQFIQLFQNQYSFFKQNPHFVVAVFSDGLMKESQRINEMIYKIMSVKIKHLKPLLIEGQQSGVFTKVISADDLTHIVMGTFRLQMYKWRMAEFQFDIEIEGNKMIQSILTLIHIN